MDGVVVQIPKKHAKRLLEWREEDWPTGNKRFRVSQLEPDSRTPCAPTGRNQHRWGLG